MALHRGQSWLTYVTTDDLVASALVLAESLRRVRTTRRVCAITCGTVSVEKRHALRRSFDHVFWLDGYYEGLIESGKKGNRYVYDALKAKVFAFSLEIFEKCVFIEPNCFLLENMDTIFEWKGTSAIWDLTNGQSDAFYLFNPSIALCEYLESRNLNKNGLDLISCVRAWTTNNLRGDDGPGKLELENVSRFSFSEFSLEKGRFLLKSGDFWGQPTVVAFVDLINNRDPVSIEAKLLEFQKNDNLGLTEKVVIDSWLSIHAENGLSAGPEQLPPASKYRKELYENEPIAIVGMSCRLPGANNLEEFWKVLYNGEEGISEPPSFRWTKEHSIYGSSGKEKHTKAGFLSTSVDDFDAKFFGVSPKDAVLLDPQARLLHEVFWESLENSGIDPLSLYGSHTGIFTGSWMNDYKDIIQASTERDFFRTYMGNSIGATAARLSFLLGLTGPSIATESGCSSAIVAVDLAVKSLRNGESNLVLAGGVNLLLHPFQSNIIDYVIAPDGRCKTFDEKADGFGRAEGCGVLVLKRLSDALRDNDNIWAMIRGSAVSQEGLSRSLGTPTVHCEALAMELALKDGGVAPEQVSFVETHGTGTTVGDPMEVAAIARAYNTKARKEPLIIGSVKTNLGHTESCSGITGIIKTVLSMQHELIPKHLNLDTINPQVNLDNIPARIPLEPIVWEKTKGQPRLAGVSSFGITGTDGHVILEEAPDIHLPRFNVGLERPLHLLKFSAKTVQALDDMLQLYVQNFKLNAQMSGFANVAYTANNGRATFGHRAFLLASIYDDALTSLQSNKVLRTDENTAETGDRKICFLFTGQGSQYEGMAKSLYETSPVFRFHFDQCEIILKESFNLSLRDVVWGNGNSKELSRTIFSQTSIFCVEYCLFKLWESWGIKPDYVLGHSLGEFCAAVAAKILSFEDALMLVVERSRLIDNLPNGSMLVIKASHQEIEALMKESNIDLDFAAINSAEQTVIAGDTEKVMQFMDICKKQEIKAIVLEASHAFHSRHMDPVLEEYRTIAETVHYSRTGTCKYISGMEGKLLEDSSSDINADYWVRHTREKVTFLEACKVLKQLDCDDFLEVGPHPVLSSFVMQNIENVPISCYPSLRRNTNEWETILTSLGKLYLRGYKVDWEGYDKPYIRKKISTLPFYPFNKKSFWVDCRQTDTPAIHPLIGHPIANASAQNIFQNDVHIKSVPYLKDHCIGNMVVFPGAGFTEMCMSSGYCVANSLSQTMDKPRRPISLENVRIEAPLELKEGKSCRLQTIVSLQETHEGSSASGFQCKIFHQNENDEMESHSGSSRNWVLHASATFLPFFSTTGLLNKWNPDRITELISSQEPCQMGGFYKTVDGAGLKFGEQFKTLQKHWFVREENGFDEIVAEMKCPDDYDKYLLHPLVIDTMIQTGLLSGWRTQSETLRVPIRIGRLTMLNNIVDKEPLYLHAEWENGDKCSVFVSTRDLTPIALLEDIEVIETNVKTIQSVLEQQNSRIPDSWEEIWKPIPGPHDNQVELSKLEPVFSQEEFMARLEAVEKGVTEEDEDHYRKMNRLVYLYSLKALFQLGWKPKAGEKIVIKDFCEKHKILPNFMQLIHFYFNTMFQHEHGIVEILEYNQNSWLVKNVASLYENELERESEILYDKLKTEERISVVVKIYRNIASHLSDILCGEKSVLSVLFPTESSSSENQEYSAEMYYQHHPGRVECKSKAIEITGTIWRHLKSLNTSENPPSGKRVYRVLEVGAGTGSMSMTAAAVLSGVWGDQFEYYFTDISPSFFAKAEKRLEESKGSFKFIAFNIEEPPLEQGIPLNYFDIVLASDVLHATKNLKQCLQNLRQTLRPQGSIFFTDTLMQDPGITFVFGLLDGYWRFEDFHWRPNHTCVDGETWRKVLLESGFEFVHVSQVYMGVMGCITAEASCSNGYDNVPDNEVTLSSNKKWILFSPGSSHELKKITTVINSSGCGVTVVLPSPETDEDDEKIASGIQSAFNTGEVQGVIYAWGMNKDVYDQRRIARPFMHLAQHILNMKKPPKVYVLTKGVHAITDTHVDFNPSAATLFGMTKSLKNESSDLFVRYVDLDNRSDLSFLTEEVLYELAMNKETKERERVQVAYRDGVRYEPRFNRSTLPQNPAKEDLQLPPSTERYQLVLPKSRIINDLEFDVLEEAALEENEVEVATRAYALNFRDIFTILKPTKEFESLNTVGLDFAGVVTKVGDKVPSDTFKVGDRVFGANFKDAQLPSHMLIDYEGLVHIPTKMTFAEAATLPAVFSTSYHCLVNVAKMKKGDTVLIHTGSGGVGLSAIQIAKQIGANIITTAGSPRKRAYLRSLGIEHVFHSRNTSYQAGIMKATNGRGVDIVLNSITGPGFKEASLSACAKNARFVEMSKLAVWTEEEVKERRSDVKYTIVDLSVTEKSAWKKILDSMKTFLNEGHASPIPYVRFDALRIRQALQYFQKAKHIGKVVVTMPEVKAVDSQWKVSIPLFNDESTYLITGGLGGIGFEVCKWMLTKGATNIVLIGRNLPKPEVAQEIDRLNNSKNMSCNVSVKLCDVGDYKQLQAVLEEISATYEKPIRGIHHCAGVLRDNLYANQNWDTFSVSYTPKVQGTWNIHNLTRKLPLEHFILYSSITALAGTPAQANHSSANCFEDAFAHYRYALGLPATTINWGQWSQVGCAKEVNVTGVLPVSVKRMLNGLEEVLRSQRLQVAFGEFESLSMWNMVCPSFKYYLDEKLIKSLKDSGVQGVNHILLKTDQFWQEMDEAQDRSEKMDLVMVYMKAILRSALRMDADEPISNDANMKDLGVDSLMLIELKNSIQSLLGSRLTVSANMLKDCNTIRELASCIVNKLYDEDMMETESSKLSPEELVELLKCDCDLEESITPPSPVTIDVNSIKTVLVTGCTGQLGPYIISSLLNRTPPLGKIICLIRMKDEKISPEEKLSQVLKSMNLSESLDMSKVECLKGDLALSNFGLDKNKYEELTESVDAVIHLAAKSNHIELYRKCEKGTRDIRSVNVGGTLNILRFASASKTKHVYYASSLLSVFGGNVDDGELCDNWPDEDDIKVLAENRIPGYPISKYVCEMLMKGANERGIPCKIFRFPWITGDSSTGQLNYNHNHYILRFMSYLKIKAMPQAPLPAIVLPVDICADLSMKIFWNENAPNEIYNIAHPNPQLEVEFVKVAKEDFHVDLELVEWDSKEFMEKLYANGMPLESLKEIYEDVDRTISVTTSSAFKAIQGYLTFPDTFFKNRKVEKYVPAFATSIPATMDTIRNDLSYVKSKGFLEKFGI